MRGVPACYEAQSELLRLGNGQVHAKGTHVQAHAHVPIDQSCGFCFLDDVDRSIRLQNAVLDAVQVNGLEPPDAVAVDPSLVCFDQDIGRDLGLLFWTPGRHEAIHHELLQIVKVQELGAWQRAVSHGSSGFPQGASKKLGADLHDEVVCRTSCVQKLGHQLLVRQLHLPVLQASAGHQLTCPPAEGQEVSRLFVLALHEEVSPDASGAKRRICAPNPRDL
mmetsp:Transcript_91330/g.217789  ORF Transcript_91330/g.217789 Transcript_91330/m.217789 type:complete len:221 (-) Transcript_91330:17-679(-)